MKRSHLAIFILLTFLVSSLYGVSTRKYEFQKYEDYLKGKFDGISVSFDGHLFLSPTEKKIEGPVEEFFLSFLMTDNGIGYLGTGHSGKIYRINEKGQSEEYFHSPEMGVYCLAQDRRGNLYAGTSPNGKIYKISKRGEGTEFFKPKEKYIWDLMFSEEGTLLAAVGESGGIYEIDQQGVGELILEAEENHILCLAKSENGDLLAGSGGKGHLYRISKNKKPVILFESPFEEIRSIALDDKDRIYVAASGVVTKPAVQKVIPTSSQTNTQITVTAELQKQILITPGTPKQPGALYRIMSTGMAKKLWVSADEMIYSLAWNEAEKKLYFGTGGKGRLYSLDYQEKVTLVFQMNSEQIYLVEPQLKKIFILSNNPPVISELLSSQRYSGEYMSHALDTGSLSSWGRMEWTARMAKDTTVQFQTRSGNTSEPNRTWSEWSPPYTNQGGEQILSPPARYIQFRMKFKSQDGNMSPVIKKLALFSVQINLQPTIDHLEILEPNVVFIKPLQQQDMIWGAESSNSDAAQAQNNMHVAMARKAEKKGYQTLIWQASDKNMDTLVYSVFIREEHDRLWRVLVEDLKEKIFAFDTISLPDGNYFVKIQASDKHANPPGSSLRDEKVSRILTIDNSQPVFEVFEANRDKKNLTLRFRVRDSLSYIREVKFLVRPKGWQIVFPEDGICDGLLEEFEITVTLPERSDNMVTVKAVDSQGNSVVHRAVF